MNPSDTSANKFSCIILAGGEGKRVGGRDKGLVEYKNRPLIEYVIDTVKPQCDEIIISANRNLAVYKSYGYKIISDEADNYRGPLAGIAAALSVCKNEWVLIVPCDMPFLPADIIDTLSRRMGTSKLCIAEADDRLQLVFLLHRSLQPSVEQALEKNQLRLMQWIKSQQPARCLFSDGHYFKNFNESKDLV